MADLGRPTKYTPEILVKAKEYLDTGYIENDELFPSHVGLCLYIGIGKSTAYDWAKEETKEAFSDIFEQIMMRQELDIVKNAMRGDYNSTIAKVMLTKHGYSDKQQTELTGSNGGPIEQSQKVEWVIQPVKPINEA